MDLNNQSPFNVLIWSIQFLSAIVFFFIDDTCINVDFLFSTMYISDLIFAFPGFFNFHAHVFRTLDVYINIKFVDWLF